MLECAPLDRLCSAADGRLNWTSAVRDWLAPWAQSGVTLEMLATAEAAMESKAPSKTIPFVRMQAQQWRVQIVDGKLYLSAINLWRHSREYAAAQPLVLLNTLKRFGRQVPNCDLLLNDYDFPVVCGRECYQEKGRVPPLIFSPAAHQTLQDVPFPDYSFYYPLKPHPLKTLRWDNERMAILRAAEAVPWAEREPRAAWSGNAHVIQPRRDMLALADANPDLVWVNDANVVNDAAATRSSCIDKAARLRPSDGNRRSALRSMRGAWRTACSMRFADLCHFRYLVAVPGQTYSNRFKQLLLCGSPVIYVANLHTHREFYETLLQPGVHYVHVDRPADVPAAVEMLRRNDAWARSIGAAGQRQMRRMDEASVESYVFTLLRSYAALQRFVPRPTRRAVQVNCEDDVYRLVRLDHRAIDFTTGDPTRCIVPPQRRPGELMSAGGRWVYQPGYVTRLGYPRFFMPGEDAEAAAAANASRTMVAKVARGCTRLDPSRRAALPARRERECREAIERLCELSPRRCRGGVPRGAVLSE